MGNCVRFAFTFLFWPFYKVKHQHLTAPFGDFFRLFLAHNCCLLETTSAQVDASCSRSATLRRRLVRRVFFPAARAAQPSGHEDLLRFALSRNGLFHSRSAWRAGCCHDFHCSHHECKVLLYSVFLVVCFIVSVSAPDAVSLSLPRIWLSRSTSKTDALDDDETSLRLTASQTAITRGVMVPGIMGALDIAPTLHFVGPGLKINGEEWVKVMDEYIAASCAALIELGR